MNTERNYRTDPEDEMEGKRQRKERGFYTEVAIVAYKRISQNTLHFTLIIISLQFHS